MSRIASTLEAGQSQFKPKARLGRGLIRQLKSEGTKRIWNRNGKLRRVKPLKKVSRSKRKRLEAYFALSTEFLLKPENYLCVICQTRREHGENITINCATEIHHHRGRIGRLLCWVPGFRASCRPCREFPHQNPAVARDWGLLAPAALWNVFPVAGN